MKKVFKMMMALGLGIGFLGLVVMVVGLALGGRPGSMQFRNGHVYFETWQDMHQWTDDWDDWDDLLDLSTGNGQNSGEGAAFQVEALRQLEVELSACQLEIRPGSSGQTGAELFLYGDLRADHVKQEYRADKGRWELEIQPPAQNSADKDYQALLLVPQQLEKLELDAGMGSVTLEDLELQQMELESGMGSVQLTNVASEDGELKADMGSISGSADLQGKTVIRSDMGTVDLQVSNPLQYRYDIHNSLGSVTIGTNEFNTDGRATSGPADAAVFYQVYCDMGAVNLRF